MLVDATVKEVEVELTWGDYVTEPPLPPEVYRTRGHNSTRNIDREVAAQCRLGAHCSLRVPKEGRGPHGARSPGQAVHSIRPAALSIEAHARPVRHPPT